MRVSWSGTWATSRSTALPLPGGNQIIGLNNGATIQTTYVQNTVIQWGSPAVLDTANKAGFNLASGKTLTFTSTAAMGVLNIDISGAMSSIDGNIVADANTIVVIANEKGINDRSGARSRRRSASSWWAAT